MFQLTIKKEDLIGSLLTVAGAVDKKQSLAILSNFLLKVSDDLLFITATDLEIEISAQVACQSNQTKGSITVPAKKFIDIIRSLDDDLVNIVFDNGTVTIKQGRSSFKLTTLPAEDYPQSEDACNEVELSISRTILLQLFQSTHFAMSAQDVRIFLNGLFLEFEANLISAVGTDGHRMAICRHPCENSNLSKLLLPKKGVHELLRLLHSINDEVVLLAAGKSHFKCVSNEFVFLSKLIDTRFPPYNKAIPRDLNKSIIIDCAILKKSLARIVILAHEKSKAVTLHMQEGQITLFANNAQEEAVETLIAETQGDELKIGLNATYLLDVLNHLSEGEVRLSLSNGDSSILVESLQQEHYLYILMPMKI